MSRSELIGVLIVALLFGLLVGSILTGVASALNDVTWFSGSANEIQWSSVVATFAGIAAGFLYLNRTCAAKRFCLRAGEHPVDGTLKKVCTVHHTLEHHESVFKKHGPSHANSDRLNRGESHELSGR